MLLVYFNREPKENLYQVWPISETALMRLSWLVMKRLQSNYQPLRTAFIGDSEQLWLLIFIISLVRLIFEEKKVLLIIIDANEYTITGKIWKYWDSKYVS